MADVTLEQVTKRFGQVSVVEGLDLQVEDREFMVLVGPSGCGKSTALRMIAGLEDITAGTISIGGRIVNDVAPKDRDIAMVFQDYALYPHMSVRQNLEFGLKIRKIPRQEVNKRVAEAAEILGITHLLDRKPKQLSGGQRQRVAVGRAIVRKPSVFLFDEPLSNLDAKLRVQMRAEITRLQRRLKTTTIYVTHDQVEAMTMGDRIAVMNDGRLKQIGTPLQLYERPANVFVAQFIGTPPMNFFPATLSDGGATLVARGFSLPVPDSHRAVTAGRDGRELLVGVRPENVMGNGGGTRGATTTLSIEVEMVETLGREVAVHGRIGDDLLVATLGRYQAPEYGAKLDLVVELEALHFFDTGTQQRLTA